ncbi:branched-chain amino acid ABC transporter substrate-binding protein [Aquamicrobium segne]|uniref:Branched-chain amino acid ABC transporter substrate-binding protein n=1 Tax=Aquamicrobium segne TaxID=469547 RepID=A0ABW0GY36_9HYPH
MKDRLQAKMRIAQIIATALSGLLLAFHAQAEPVTIGIAAPLSGPFERLGQQIAAGAKLAATGHDIQLAIIDDQCSAAGGEHAARHFVEQKAQIAIGFLCTQAVEAASPLLMEAGIPVIMTGPRTESLTDQKNRTGWPLFRLGPRDDDERNAIADMLTRRWKSDYFAIIDDGTIYGRELAGAFREKVRQAALEPVFIDTFRPGLDNQIALAGRLKRAGATHAFVGGDAADIAIMARDAAKLDADMTFAGGEALRSAAPDVPFAVGTLMIAPPEWADVAEPVAVQAFLQAGIQAEGYALPAYAAIQIALSAIKSDRPVIEVFSEKEFATSIGPVRFNAQGDLAQNLYRLYRFDGQDFVQIEAE